MPQRDNDGASNTRGAEEAAHGREAEGRKKGIPKEAEFQALLAQARAGSKEALVEAVERSLPFARVVASRIAFARRSFWLTQSDFNQLLFIAALNDFECFVGESFLEFTAWLATILSRECIDSVRSANAQKRGGGKIQHLSAIDVVDTLVKFEQRDPVVSETIDREEREQLQRAMRRLEPHEREVVELRSSGLSFKSIGEIVSQTADAARMVHNRAVEKLKRLVGGHAIHEGPAECGARP